MTIRSNASYQLAQLKVDQSGHVGYVYACTECGALVQQNDWSQHLRWHRNLAQAVGSH